MNSLNFGSFTLLAKIARGDIGDLFLARSQGAGGFEKLVVIKRIHPEFMKDDEISRLFHSEAQTAARIEHPNVRIVYEIGSNDEHHYIALEYLEGAPLVEVLLGRKRDRRLADPRLIAALISQACQGLHAAHKMEHRGQPLIHGDINPRSIFVTESGTTKLLDFDIVEMRGALAKRHGFVRRTIAYMSPEEVRSDICDRRSDIFSLGVVAWEAITGRRLFKQGSRDQTLAAIDRGLIPNPKELQTSISDALNATIMRALSRDPSLRFQTAQDFGSALDRATLEEGPPLTPVAVSTLIKHTFADSLEKQRELVRTARRSQDGSADDNPKASFSEFEKPTIVGDHLADPDDWNSEEPATTVGGAELVAAIEAMHESGDFSDSSGASTKPQVGQGDPFQEVSQSADFSIVGDPPIWQDTRNLVLSEATAESISAGDDDEKTGAVVLANIDNFDVENYELGEPAPTIEDETFDGGTDVATTPGNERTSALPGGHSSRSHPGGHPMAPGYRPGTAGDERTTAAGRKRRVKTARSAQPYRDKMDSAHADTDNLQKFGPPPSLDAPFVAATNSVSDRGTPYFSPAPSIYDRRLSTLESRPQKPFDSTQPTPEEVSSHAKPAPKSARRSLIHYVIGILAVAAITLAALLFFASDKEKPNSASATTTSADNVQATRTSSKPATNSGAGAAAGILAAAGNSAGASSNGIVIPSDHASDAEEEPSSDASVAPQTHDEPGEAGATIDAGASTSPVETAREDSPDASIDSKSADTDTVAKKPDPKGPADGVAPKNANKTTKAATRKRNTKRGKSNRIVAKAKSNKPEAKGPGYLTVAASPYATVFVNGKKRGITPLVKLKLPPGVHRLKLVSSAGGKSKNMKVRIKSGDIVRQNVRF